MPKHIAEQTDLQRDVVKYLAEAANDSELSSRALRALIRCLQQQEHDARKRERQQAIERTKRRLREQQQRQPVQLDLAEIVAKVEKEANGDEYLEQLLFNGYTYERGIDPFADCAKVAAELGISIREDSDTDFSDADA